MKPHSTRSISIFAALIILVQVTGCNLLQSGANEYNDLVAWCRVYSQPPLTFNW
jgi:hypothetical protein